MWNSNARDNPLSLNPPLSTIPPQLSPIDCHVSVVRKALKHELSNCFHFIHNRIGDHSLRIQYLVKSFSQKLCSILGQGMNMEGRIKFEMNILGPINISLHVFSRGRESHWIAFKELLWWDVNILCRVEAWFHLQCCVSKDKNCISAAQGLFCNAKEWVAFQFLVLWRHQTNLWVNCSCFVSDGHLCDLPPFIVNSTPGFWLSSVPKESCFRHWSSFEQKVITGSCKHKKPRSGKKRFSSHRNSTHEKSTRLHHTDHHIVFRNLRNFWNHPWAKRVLILYHSDLTLLAASINIWIWTASSPVWGRSSLHDFNPDVLVSIDGFLQPLVVRFSALVTTTSSEFPKLLKTAQRTQTYCRQRTVLQDSEMFWTNQE